MQHTAESISTGHTLNLPGYVLMLNFLLAMLQEFQKLIGKSKKPILTMFYAPWCGHCKRLKPEFAAAATETKTTTVLAGINADKPALSQLRMALNVTGYPTLFLFRYVQYMYSCYTLIIYTAYIHQISN